MTVARWLGVLMLAGAACLASPLASAQGFGIAPATPQTGPGMGPGPAPPQQGATPSLEGAWSGQAMTANGAMQQTDYFAADGTFTSVARLENGFVGRAWGQYRVTPLGPAQVRVETRLQGWLPRQICQQQGGCQPFQLPATSVSTVSFLSPTMLVAVHDTDMTSITQQRDNNPALLQVQVPQQFVIPMPASAAPPSYQPAPSYQAPVITPYQSPLRPSVRHCDDLQQQRICAINDGHLISSGGCMVCVGP